MQTSQMYPVSFFLSDSVLTSAFTGVKQMIMERGGKTISLDQAQRLSLTTSPSITTIEFLKLGDRISVKIGRKGTRSNVKSINFAMRQIV